MHVVSARSFLECSLPILLAPCARHIFCLFLSPFLCILPNWNFLGICVHPSVEKEQVIITFGNLYPSKPVIQTGMKNTITSNHTFTHFSTKVHKNWDAHNLIVHKSDHIMTNKTSDLQLKLKPYKCNKKYT